MRVSPLVLVLGALAFAGAGFGLSRVLPLGAQAEQVRTTPPEPVPWPTVEPVMTGPPPGPNGGFMPAKDGLLTYAKEAQVWMEAEKANHRNVVLPCGHRWRQKWQPGGFLSSGGFDEFYDMCDQGHLFMVSQGVYVAAPGGSVPAFAR